VRNLIKTIISVIIIAVLAIVALKLVGFALRVVLPIAILAFIAYVIYLLVTGRRHETAGRVKTLLNKTATGHFTKAPRLCYNSNCIVGV